MIRYINRLEDAHKKALRSKLPITNARLAAISTSYLLFCGSFSKLRPDWDSKPATEKSWDGWKTWSQNAQKTVK